MIHLLHLHRAFRPMLPAAVLAFATLLAGAPASAQPISCPPGADTWNEYRMFFGRNGADGTEVVSDADWTRFLAYEVTSRFPSGLSVLEVAGQWRNDAGAIVRERSKLLLVLAPPGDEALGLTEEIMAAYKTHFGQQGVLRTVNSSCVSFH